MASKGSIARKEAAERQQLLDTLEAQQKEITALKSKVTKLENRVKELEGGK